MEEIKEKLKGLAIIVPCLNPDEKLMQVVGGMLAQGFSHILVVNDGSSPDYQPFFDEAAAVPECTVLGYEVNRGKGYALRTGPGAKGSSPWTRTTSTRPTTRRTWRRICWLTRKRS